MPYTAFPSHRTSLYTSSKQHTVASSHPPKVPNMEMSAINNTSGSNPQPIMPPTPPPSPPPLTTSEMVARRVRLVVENLTIGVLMLLLLPRHIRQFYHARYPTLRNKINFWFAVFFILLCIGLFVLTWLVLRQGISSEKDKEFALAFASSALSKASQQQTVTVAISAESKTITITVASSATTMGLVQSTFTKMPPTTLTSSALASS